MNRRITALLLGSLLAAEHAHAQAPPQEAAARPAHAILRDFDSVVYPSFSEGSDPESLARFRKTIDDASHRQEALALELLKAAPNHARVPELLRRRWELLVNVDHDFGRVRQETTRLLAAREAHDARIVPLALALRAWACVDDESLPFATRAEDLERAIDAAPTEYMAQAALLEFAQRKCCDPEFQRKAAERIAALDPGGAGEGGEARRLAKLVEVVGKPLDAALVDDSSQRPFRLESLRGHPLLLSFLPSPWSEREPAEAAAVKSLAQEFAARGLELVVVHEIYTEEERADRRRHIAELALPGRAHVALMDREESLKRQLLGVELPAVSLLLDRDGRVVALCCESAPLREAIARLCEAKPKRRAI
jgi:hypothetical protein